ncbi:MAG: DUF6434 domain-containing protein [Chloroflexota bacterium]
MTDETRPEINSITSGAELKRWYWLKADLVAYCKAHGIPYGAKKFTLLDRIAHYMDTGEILRGKQQKISSDFDWAHETLTLETVITDSYKNNSNVRAFMEQHIGTHFSFNIAFMRWMKANTGKTLADAIHQWDVIHQRKNEPDYQEEIPDHNQFNQYLRDFFADNPELTIREARQCWAYKIKQPSDTGRHRYAPEDLVAIGNS